MKCDWLLLFAVTCDCKKLRAVNDMLVVIREAKKLFSVIGDNSQLQSNFSMKMTRRRPTKSTKQREALRLSLKCI